MSSTALALRDLSPLARVNVNPRPKHSPVGASGYYRWKNCPGSVRKSRGIPKKSSTIWADLGRRAHEAAEFRLTFGFWHSSTDREMRAFLKDYIEFIEGYAGLKGAILFIEHSFHLEYLHPALYGTADAVIYVPHQHLLVVVDLKYGARVVEVEDNLQLQYYALGALDLFAREHPDLKVKRVQLCIFQPRHPHPLGYLRWQDKHPLDFIEFEAQLLEDVTRTEDPAAPLIPGDWCEFCPASATCEAKEEQANAVMAFDFEGDPGEYDPARLAQLLKWLPIFEKWIKRVRHFAYTEAMRGQRIPGHKLVDKYGRRRFKGHVDAELLEMLFGVDHEDIVDPEKLKGPAKIEKLLSSEDRGALSKLYEMHSSGLVLVSDTDRRAESYIDPEEDFDAVVEAEWERVNAENEETDDDW